jgi:hypothetical protein
MRFVEAAETAVNSEAEVDVVETKDTVVEADAVPSQEDEAVEEADEAVEAHHLEEDPVAPTNHKHATPLLGSHTSP